MEQDAAELTVVALQDTSSNGIGGSGLATMENGHGHEDLDGKNLLHSQIQDQDLFSSPSLGGAVQGPALTEESAIDPRPKPSTPSGKSIQAAMDYFIFVDNPHRIKESSSNSFTYGNVSINQDVELFVHRCDTCSAQVILTSLQHHWLGPALAVGPVGISDNPHRG